MSDSELYGRLLFPKKQGYPLFHPQPFDDLPEPARKTGTEIGDVGLITQDGAFDPIFNILRGGDDPSNRFGVPRAFEQVLLGPKDIATHAQCHLPGSDISNTTISKRRLDFEAGTESNVFLPVGAGAVVEVSTNSKQTGLLLLPDGASRWDLRPQQLFRDYALKHAENWYTFVNGNLRRMAGNGDLYLVTGVTKSTSWGVAAVENHSSEGKLSLKLKAAQIGNGSATYTWEWESAGSSVNAGPRRRAGEEEWRDNQTVFLRGFKVTVRSMSLRRAAKVRAITQSKWSEMQSKGTFIPFSSQSQSSAPGTSLPSFQPQSSEHNQNSLSPGPSSTRRSIESTSDDDTPSLSCYHPSALINDYLLDSVIDATVAVTHDDQWASVMTEQDSEVPDNQDLIRRILNKFQMPRLRYARPHILTWSDYFPGGVCLEPVETDMLLFAPTLSPQMSSTNNSEDGQHPLDIALGQSTSDKGGVLLQLEQGGSLIPALPSASPAENDLNTVTQQLDHVTMYENLEWSSSASRETSQSELHIDQATRNEAVKTEPDVPKSTSSHHSPAPPAEDTVSLDEQPLPSGSSPVNLSNIASGFERGGGRYFFSTPLMD
ncbi:Tkl tkl-ccin protein kinase [Mycena venus]|uniref:Tkl tkl-ccin protein kinase n=1 Tax=Mycena venus TaxID=2733690 RepID=A0A8H6XP90_9AGAR|nr:Tkl tkl-ccin protein kinase [Mycena venus]